MVSSLRIGSAGGFKGPGSRGVTPILPQGKPIDMEEAIAVKTLILGSGRKTYPEGWPGQAFTFHYEAYLLRPLESLMQASKFSWPWQPSFLEDNAIEGQRVLFPICWTAVQ